MNEMVKYESMDDLERLGKAMVASGYFEDAASISKAIVKILAGREMGFGPIASMNGIHVIKGKPAIGANLMAAKVKAHLHYDYRVKVLNDTACVIVFFQDGQEIGESPFTVQDAQKAGTQNMGRFPRNMLFARAMSNGVKWFCPDVFLSGPVYTPDELGAIVDDDGAIVDMPAVIVEKPRTPDPTPDLDYDGNPLDDTQLEADIAHAGEVAAESAAAPDLSAFDATPFNSVTAATAWAIAQRAFGKPDGGTAKHARNAWDKATAGAQNDSERAQMWRADVARRMTEAQV